MKNREILTKIGYVRNQSNLSARELSLRMGKSPQYVSKLESGNITLSVENLIDILTICNFPIERFFYSNPDEYETDKELLSLIKTLPRKKKEHLIAFLNSKD